ncbi:dihydrodipicolinate synthase family protein [Amycolatopsis sp. GM8]|uniref:dihydrodipicolinate synthase family protein n=1 Tax=Amycolatopsis sp. GM8 TaxID=2896530 RepID=UPI001F015B82|nr:dihydrodipicolinate synthase family protein [Amycolatopsis sp. GM8]
MTYRGLYVDLAVPRDDRGDPFERRFVVHAQQMRRVVEVAGVIVNGPLSTHELFDGTQRERLARLAVETAPAGFPVLSGVFAEDVTDAGTGVEFAESIGASGVVLVTSMTFGLHSALDAAGSWSIPTVVVVAGGHLDDETVARLGTRELAPSVGALAVADTTLARYGQVLAAAGSRVDVLPYSWSGAGVAERLALGGAGAIVAAANLAPAEFGRLVAAATAGDWAAAGALLPLTVRTAAVVGAEEMVLGHPAQAVDAALRSAGSFPGSRVDRLPVFADVSSGRE